MLSRFISKERPSRDANESLKVDHVSNSSTGVRSCSCVTFGAQKEYTRKTGDTFEGLWEGHQSVAETHGRVVRSEPFAHVDRHEERVAT